ncbi:acid phosphatase/vanadium-dependent haloperoxidase protein-related protein [Tanacetum coccineum]
MGGEKHCKLITASHVCVYKRDDTRYKENRWDLEQLIRSGGMPSLHSATVTALAVATGLHDLEVLPPLPSPFVDTEAEGYVPEYADTKKRLQATSCNLHSPR